MIAHNWMAGALFQACHASCQPGPPPPQHQRQCRHWRHHHPDAQQLPCANLQHQQSGATPPKLPQPGHNLTSVGPRGGVAAPKEHPWLAGGTFCKHANLALCHPASNGGATLLPSASSWQCISNANFREAHAKERLDLPRREAEGGQVAVMGKARTNVTLSRHIFYHNEPDSWDIDVPEAVRPTDCFGLS